MVELWGGLHDGGKIELPHDSERYVVTINEATWVYAPLTDSDYLTNTFRYIPGVHQ